MKKIFFILFVICTVTSFNINAQHRIESPSPDLQIRLQRVTEANGTVTIDMLLTNLAKDAKVSARGGYRRGGFTNETVAFDDEGNRYMKEITVGIQGDLRVEYEYTLPQDVPVKVRIQIDEVDKNATMFPIIKITLDSRENLHLNPEKPLVVRNLEFERQ